MQIDKPLQPITLTGNHVHLIPLSLDHLDRLCELGLNEDIWRWMQQQVGTRDDMRAFIEEALEGERAGTMLPFAQVDAATGLVIGTTRYGNIDRANRRVEIGWTWIGAPWQRTAINTESKFLLLRHAFEMLGCIRVELKTDALNERSRRAILRIGATEEGILRRHVIISTGRIRDTVCFSVLDSEWPGVKARLSLKLESQM
ncbi:MAG: GNAT family protein [Bacteroidota bacterium]